MKKLISASNPITNNTWSFFKYTIEDELGRTLCEISRYPDNCSIAVMHNVRKQLVNTEVLVDILDFLSENPYSKASGSYDNSSPVWHLKPTMLQVTTNDETWNSLFTEAGFKVLHKYTSRGSDNVITLLQYEYVE